jgi:NADPH-ferrihemoprotein reductase
MRKLQNELTVTQAYKNDMGDSFEMLTAFSRDGAQKVYVQHLLKQRAAEIDRLLQQKAYFYVCGDAANMAREVNTVLGQIIAEQRGISESKAEDIVKAMRNSNAYQEDVWS